jgi:CCR4-NOT transcription complex subunit 7/8
MAATGAEPQVRQVWAHNVVQEFHLISMVVEQGKHRFASIDTEFPGFVYKANDGLDFWTKQWDTLRLNVDNLRLIQFGLAIADENGNPPPGCGVWQFNFTFDASRDARSESSMKLLRESGCDFDKHRDEGICPFTFGEMLTASGLVLNENMKWISFHGGYDFAYLVKALTGGQALPARVGDMLNYVDLFFPCRCDMKFLLREMFRGSLQSLATQMRVAFSSLHQAGSDALVTRAAFFRLDPDLRRRAFDGRDKEVGLLNGLGADTIQGVDPVVAHQKNSFSSSVWRDARQEWIGPAFTGGMQDRSRGGWTAYPRSYYEEAAQELSSTWTRQEWVSWPTAESWGVSPGVWTLQTISGDQRVPQHQAAMVF